MRTTKKRLDELMESAAAALECPRSQVFTRCRAIAGAFLPAFRAAGFSAVELSPYRSGRWTLSAMQQAQHADGTPNPHGAVWTCLPIDFAELVDDPARIVAEFCELCAN